MAAADSKPLSSIIGDSLDSVMFVADYVQLHFGDTTVNAYNPPAILVEDCTYDWGAHGYRDALCARLTARVNDASVNHASIFIAFGDGAALVIPFDDDGYEDAEISGPAGTWVWQEIHASPSYFANPS